jgi:MtN3 and saliva related transmembrane protein
MFAKSHTVSAMPLPEVVESINPQLVHWIGTTAAVLTTSSFLPQAWLTFRSRDVSGISLSMYSAFTAGVALWLVYGLALGSWPITIANAITLSLAVSILAMKLVYRNDPPAPTQD